MVVVQRLNVRLAPRVSGFDSGSVRVPAGGSSMEDHFCLSDLIDGRLPHIVCLLKCADGATISCLSFHAIKLSCIATEISNFKHKTRFVKLSYLTFQNFDVKDVVFVELNSGDKIPLFSGKFLSQFMQHGLKSQ